jgi:DNA-binding transcriptional MerR regulator
VSGVALSDPSTRSDYSIAAVSKLTGVSCHALRVWERRYGFPVPERSASGHRRYNPDQVRLLSRIADLMREGSSIGELIADLNAGRLSATRAPVEPIDRLADRSAGGLVDRLLAGDLAKAEAFFHRISQGLSPVELIDRVIEPALVDVGERWFRRECGIFQERFASGFVRRKLECLLEVLQRGNLRPRHTALIGTVQGDRHEGGVLILGVLLELSGWRALLLGVDLPVAEYQKAIDLWRPDALGLSFVLSRNIHKRFEELGRIQGLPVFVGGRSILNYQGLARKHGLIPLPGPATQSVNDLIAQFQEWSQ